MLWISSWISTVLPTPAPPKRPTLPPLTYGAIRSMTLIPVSKISIFGERSRNSGGSRWIGQRSPASPAAACGRPARRARSRSGRASRSPTGTRDRRAGVDDVDRRGRGRRSSPSRPRAPGRRPGAAAPRPASARRRPRRDLDLERVVDLGQVAGNTASMTTPLISITLPTFCGRSCWSGQAWVSWRGGSG